MTIHAPCHVVDFPGRSYLWHGGNIPVTLLTLNAFCNVRVVIEIDKVRNMIDPRPTNRFLRFPCLSYFDNFRLRRCNELMATHACLNGRDVGVWTTPNSAVTILAVHLVVTRMSCMTEGDWLARAGVGALTGCNEQ